MTDKKPQTDRTERRAQALRANLFRRKQASRREPDPGEASTEPVIEPISGNPSIPFGADHPVDENTGKEDEQAKESTGSHIKEG